MNEIMNGVRGEVSEYTWGRLWSDGTREFNNGAILYVDGSLEFDGLTFYPDGVIIDAAGRQVGLAETIDETQDHGQSAIDEEADFIEQEEVEDAANPVDEFPALNIEDSDDVESYMSLGGDER